jgi:threonine-phosphate decarboxylase
VLRMLERYGHGGDLLTASEAYGRSADGFIDFSSNMNPFGPPSCVERIMRERWRDACKYPDPAVRELRHKLSQAYGIPPESILVGNGAAELIDLAVRVLGPSVTGLARPSFSEYEEAVHKIGGQIRDIPLRAENEFVLEMDAAVRAMEESDLVFLGHPNNPTGRLVPQDVLERLAGMGKPLILDEAFMDFVEGEEEYSWLQKAAGSQHILVVRSMTKFYSIPGIRLGFIVGHPDRIEQLRQLQVTWSVNYLAQLIGIEALDDQEYASRAKSWLAEERPWLISRLRELGLSVVPGDVNYLLFSFAGHPGVRIGEVQRELGMRGVLVRDASRFPGLDDTYCRIAIRLREDNEKLLAELGNVLDVLRNRAAAARTEVRS